MKQYTKEQTTKLIIEAVEKSGLTNTQSKARPTGCPKQLSCIDELKKLTKHQFHAAFILGLFGNNNKSGSIINNGYSYKRN